MIDVVADASVLLRIVLPGQDPRGVTAAAMADAMERHVAFLAPDLLAYEVGQAATRLRADPEAQAAVLPRVLQLATLVRPSAEEHRAALRIARDEKVSFYDASYVALARSRASRLWTEDESLLRRCPDVALDTRRLAALYE